MTRLALGSAAWVALGVVLGACTAIVGRKVEGFACAGTDLSACPTGNFCKGGTCTACEPLDVCDGVDNDCNGTVDDGPALCPAGERCDSASKRCIAVGVDPDGGVACNAQNCPPPRTCNLDTGTCEEAPVSCNADNCPPPKVCNARGECTSPSQTCSPATCAAPNVCDPDTGACVSPTGQLGDPCASNSACASGLCGDSRILTEEVVTALGSIVCTKACCTSAECSSDSVCFGTGAGSYCVPKRGVGYDGALGDKQGGTTCAGNEECRSGICDVGRCVDGCCKASDCASGSTCRVRSGVRGHTVFACGATTATGEQGASCGSNSTCKSNFCKTSGTLANFECAARCCGAASCPSSRTCNDETPTGATTDTVSVCSFPATQGALPTGAECNASTPSACKGNRCYNFGGTLGFRCSDICCVDADCGDPAWVCRLRRISTTTTEERLRCVPK